MHPMGGAGGGCARQGSTAAGRQFAAGGAYTVPLTLGLSSFVLAETSTNRITFCFVRAVRRRRQLVRKVQQVFLQSTGMEPVEIDEL